MNLDTLVEAHPRPPAGSSAALRQRPVICAVVMLARYY